MQIDELLLALDGALLEAELGIELGIELALLGTELTGAHAFVKVARGQLGFSIPSEQVQSQSSPYTHRQSPPQHFGAVGVVVSPQAVGAPVHCEEDAELTSGTHVPLEHSNPATHCWICHLSPR